MPPGTPFLVALQFLTRLPSPPRLDTTLDDLSRSIAWFPIVGALLGTLLVAADWVIRPALAPPVTNALLLAALVAATGALHLDGLVDALDGLTSGATPTARLAAMHQTVVGGTGVLAACLLLIADYTALSALDGELRAPALFLAPLCGRTAIVLAYGLYPYGRPATGVSWALKQGATPKSMLTSLAAAGLLACVAGGVGGLLLLLLALALMHGLASLVLARVPGLTGDVYGAICEITQLAVWLAAPFALQL